MKVHIRIQSLFLCFTVICFLAGLPAYAADQSHELKFAQVVYPKGSNHWKAIKTIGETITEKTDGRISFTYYGPELADYTECAEMVMRGSIDMALNVIPSSLDKRWNVTNIPYLVDSYEEAREVFGPGGFMNELYSEWAKKTNKIYLGTWIQGFRGVSTNKVATTAEEAEGIKIRVPPEVIFKHYWSALGFSPVLIPFSEVPTSISTGVVDGQAGGGPYQSWVAVRDLNDTFIWYRDSLENWGFTMNIETWESLSEDDRRIVQNAVTEQIEKRMYAAEKEDKDYLKKLKEYGWTVVDMQDHPQKLAEAKKRCRETWTVLDKIVGQEPMDFIRKKVDEKGL